jgi:chromosome segregation ATPase
MDHRKHTQPTPADMARLSGLPSEHHHKGPGDAPRKRGRPSKNQTSSQQSQSQEMASSSKRTASPLELSQTKRTKHVQDDDEDQIAEEIQQSFSRSQRGDTIHVDTQSSSIATTTRRNGRRHSEFPASYAAEEEDDDDDEDALVPASAPSSSGLTPHLNRVGAVKRDFATIRRARRSLPAQLGVERVDEQIGGSQFQYAPLTAVLDGRTRRRLRRSHLSQEVNDFEDHQKQDKKRMLELRQQLKAQDAKIKDLEFQLEAGRLGSIEVDTTALENQLDDAREEINALRASSLYNGSEREMSQDMSAFDGAADMSDDEDQQMVLVNPDDLHLSRDIDAIATPNGKYSQRVQELSSQMTFDSLHEVSQLVEDSLIEDNDIIPDKIEDQAVERYEREIQQHVHALAEAQGALRLVTIELQNLSFLERGASSNDILVELRHGFGALRQEIEKYFPNTTTGLTNQQLLRKVPELFGDVLLKLKETLAQFDSSQHTVGLLRVQYESVLDMLAESTDRVKELEQKEYSLDKSNEEKQRTIMDLEEQVTTLTKQTDVQDADIKDKNDRIIVLEEDVEDKDTALQRLRDASETYRKDLASVQQTVILLEAEHKDTIVRMEEEHGNTVLALQADLDTEQAARDAAETDAQQKGEYIEDLERRVENTEAEVDKLTEELAELVAQLTTQTAARQNAEGQRDEQAEIVEEFANTIEGLNQTIFDLRAQIKEFQDNLATERAQREKTEAALDEANDKIDELTIRVRDEGITSNELRAKLFQLQQEKAEQIAQLEEETQDREDALNDQLTNEQEARNVAEKTVEKLGRQIEELEARLATTEVDLDNMTDARQQLEQDREQQVAVLNQQLIDLKAKYTALETSSQSTIDALQANIIDLNNQVQRQQSEIKRLTQEVADKDALYEQDTTLLKEQIVELEEDLDNERAENVKNRKEIDSLAQRVESEANELLSVMNSHNDESTALKTTISTLEATITNHQENARQYTIEYQDTVTSLNGQIEDLQVEGIAHVETITKLHSQIEDLKHKFAKQEEDTRVTIDALNLSHRRLLEENEALAAALKQRNADTLKAVQEMKAANVTVKPQSVDLHRVQTGKVVKTTEKVKVGKKGSKKRVATRSWRDSGMFEDQEDDVKGGAAEEVDEDFLAA